MTTPEIHAPYDEVVIDLPTTPELVIDPPADDVFEVVAIDGPPGQQGEPGLPGDVAGQIQMQRPAAVNLSGHRLVTELPDGSVTYASNDNLAHRHAPLWLTLGATMAGGDATVLVYGQVVEPSWNWTPGPLYLGAGGLLTQIPPTAPDALFLVQIGFATGPTTAFIDRLFSVTLL